MISRTAKSTLRALMRRYVQRYFWVTLSTVLTLLSCYYLPLLWTTPKARYLDIVQTRTLFALRGDIAPPPEVVILAIDDSSFQKLNLPPSEPLPRAIVAEALEALTAAPPKILIKDLYALPNSEDPEADKAIAAALAKLPVTMSRGNYGTKRGKIDKEVFFATDPAFSTAVRAVREMSLGFEQDVSWFLGKPADKRQEEDYQFPLLRPLRELGGYEIKTPSPYSLINFYGPAGTFQFVGIEELVREESRAEAQEKLRDKVVLFGLLRNQGRIQYEDSKDIFFHAHSNGLMFGVEIWANVAANLIEDSYIRRLTPEGEALVLFGFILAVCFCLLFSPGLLNFVVAFGLWLTYGVVTYLAFVHFKLFLPGVFFLGLATTLIAVVGVSFEKLRIYYLRRSVKQDLGLDLKYGKM
jgi:CHASE2 domain-containing sensor protein